MCKFKEDMRVIVIGDNNEIKRGTIKNVHNAIKIAIVEMSDGSVEKVRFSNIGIVNDEPTQETEAKAEIQEGAKVITKKKFEEVLLFVTDPENMIENKDMDPASAMIKGLSVMLIGSKIKEKLYQDKEEIEITKDQLFDVIKESTMPSKVAESTKGKMSEKDVVPISLLALLLLMELVQILFDDSEDLENE